MRLVDLRTKAKIRQLDVAIEREENVVGLDVTVDDTFGVQELQTVEYLLWSAISKSKKNRQSYLATDCSNLRLTHHVESDNVRQTTTLHVLHDDP